MANPAELLASQLRAWKGGQLDSADKKRGKFAGDVATAHVRAVQHLVAIDALITEMEKRGKNMASYRQNWDRWVQAVFLPSSTWTAQGSARVNDHALNSLENLAVALDPVCPPLSGDDFSYLEDYLSQVEATLEEDQTIPEDMESHLRAIIDHIRWCVENYEKTGDFDLREAVTRLDAAVVKASKFSRREDLWAKFRDKAAIPAVVNIATVGAIEGGRMLLGG